MLKVNHWSNLILFPRCTGVRMKWHKVGGEWHKDGQSDAKTRQSGIRLWKSSNLRLGQSGISLEQRGITLALGGISHRKNRSDFLFQSIFNWLNLNLFASKWKKIQLSWHSSHTLLEIPVGILRNTWLKLYSVTISKYF